MSEFIFIATGSNDGPALQAALSAMTPADRLTVNGLAQVLPWSGNADLCRPGECRDANDAAVEQRDSQMCAWGIDFQPGGPGGLRSTMLATAAERARSIPTDRTAVRFSKWWTRRLCDLYRE